MVSLPVYNRSGVEVGRYEIEPAELAPRINRQLLHDVVVMYQANRRQGTARTKNRSEVKGTTAKMYRQKGTGRARAGSVRSGVRRGGGHIHALRPRDWSYRLPKKAVRMATRMALAARIMDQEVILIDELSFSEPRTRQMAEVLKALEIGEDTSLLVAVEQYDVNVYKTVRNLARASVLPVAELNALEILRPRRLLMTTAALDAFRRKAAAENGRQFEPVSWEAVGAVVSSKTTPAETAPRETGSAETETAPTQTTPPGTAPAETTPPETQSVETASAEGAPADAGPSQDGEPGSATGETSPEENAADTERAW